MFKIIADLCTSVQQLRSANYAMERIFIMFVVSKNLSVRRFYLYVSKGNSQHF